MNKYSLPRGLCRSLDKRSYSQIFLCSRDDHWRRQMAIPCGGEGLILVADDNEANRELLSTLLGQEGYQVISVSDGQRALEQMNKDSIDLALLDVVMPRKSGFDVCLAIKSK